MSWVSLPWNGLPSPPHHRHKSRIKAWYRNLSLLSFSVERASERERERKKRNKNCYWKSSSCLDTYVTLLKIHAPHQADWNLLYPDKYREINTGGSLCTILYLHTEHARTQDPANSLFSLFHLSLVSSQILLNVCPSWTLQTDLM